MVKEMGYITSFRITNAVDGQIIFRDNENEHMHAAHVKVA
jgi:hypothetical protein